MSTGLVFPRTRHETVVAAVAVQRLLAGEIEELRVPENPLDVLAQQTVAAAVASAVPGGPDGPDGLDADAWFETVRRAAPFRRLPVRSSPAGSSTVYCPRSGMVPPEVTASRCAPGRAVSVPLSRS